jgi:hypothetical protein
MKKLLWFIVSIILSLVLLFNVINALADTNDIIVLDGNEYDISLVNHAGYNWIYHVEELNGAKNLSHFVLGFCEGIIVSTDPPYDAVNAIDHTTQLFGVKWNTPSEFISGTFTVTVDNLYAETLIPIAAKTGTFTGTINIIGPNCEFLEEPIVTPTNTEVVTPTNTLTPTVVIEDTPTPTVTITIFPFPTMTNTVTIDIEPTMTLVEIPTENTPIPTEEIIVPIENSPTATIEIEAPTDIDETPEPLNINNKKMYLPITKQ